MPVERAKLVTRGRRLEYLTLAWNGFRHLELYYAVSGMQVICHTINPRLSHDDIAYIVNDAEDSIIFAETTFAALIEAVAPHVRIFGAQSENTAAMSKSLAAGKLVEIDNLPTLADGLAGHRAEVMVRHEDGHFITEWVYGEDVHPGEPAHQRAAEGMKLSIYVSPPPRRSAITRPCRR